jgi:hypothetical protein
MSQINCNYKAAYIQGRPVKLRPKFLPNDYVYWGEEFSYSGEVFSLQPLNLDSLATLQYSSSHEEFFFFDVDDLSTRWVYLIHNYATRKKYWVDQKYLYDYTEVDYYRNHPEKWKQETQRQKQMSLVPIAQTLENVVQRVQGSANVPIFEPGDIVKWRIFSPLSKEYPVFVASGKVIRSLYVASFDQLKLATQNCNVLYHNKIDSTTIPGWWYLLEFDDSLKSFSCWWPEQELSIVDDRTTLPFYYGGYVVQYNDNAEMLARCTQSLINTITPPNKPRLFNLGDEVAWHTYMVAGCGVEDGDFIHDGVGIVTDAMYVQSDFLPHQFLSLKEATGTDFVDWDKLYEIWLEREGVVGWIYRVVDTQLSHGIWTTEDGLRLCKHAPITHLKNELYKFYFQDGSACLAWKNSSCPDSPGLPLIAAAPSGMSVVDFTAPCSFLEEMALHPRRQANYENYIRWKARPSKLMCDPLSSSLDSFMEIDDDSRD